MKWKARLRFKACGYRLVRQELDSAGNAVGEPVATPYCPDGGLYLVYLRDDEGREFQIGTDAIDIRFNVVGEGEWALKAQEKAREEA